MMPLFTVRDEDPALLSLRPLKMVLSTGLALSIAEAGGLMEGCFVGQSHRAGKKRPTEGLGWPRALSAL